VIDLLPSNDPFLREVAEDVTDIQLQVEPVIEEMKLIMMRNRVCGLAAPQVGIPMRFFLYKHNGVTRVAINPVVTHRSMDTAIDREGSLSKRGYVVRVRRSRKIDVEHMTLDGNRAKHSFKSTTARCFQHELDHLNGICIFPPE